MKPLLFGLACTSAAAVLATQHNMPGTRLKQTKANVETPAVSKDQDAFSFHCNPLVIQGLHITGDCRSWVCGLQAGTDDQGMKQEKTRQPLRQEVTNGARQEIGQVQFHSPLKYISQPGALCLGTSNSILTSL